MQRDWELIRKIVLSVESSPVGYAPNFEFDGYSSEQIGYHCYLLADMGYAVGDNTTTLDNDTPEGTLYYLTAAGHDFAEACRNETIWKSTMKLVKEKTGAVTIGVLNGVLAAALRSLLNLP